MLVSEACQLVLQAASIARGGELFVLDMGKPVKIADLAQKMLLLSGKEELGIEYVGLHSGSCFRCLLLLHWLRCLHFRCLPG